MLEWKRQTNLLMQAQQTPSGVHYQVSLPEIKTVQGQGPTVASALRQLATELESVENSPLNVPFQMLSLLADTVQVLALASEQELQEAYATILVNAKAGESYVRLDDQSKGLASRVGRALTVLSGLPKVETAKQLAECGMRFGKFEAGQLRGTVLERAGHLYYYQGNVVDQPAGAEAGTFAAGCKALVIKHIQAPFPVEIKWVGAPELSGTQAAEAPEDMEVLGWIPAYSKFKAQALKSAKKLAKQEGVGPWLRVWLKDPVGSVALSLLAAMCRRLQELDDSGPHTVESSVMMASGFFEDQGVEFATVLDSALLTWIDDKTKMTLVPVQDGPKPNTYLTRAPEGLN